MPRFHPKKKRPTLRSHTAKWKGHKVKAFTNRKRYKGPSNGISAITAVINSNRPQYGVVKSHLRVNAVPSAVAYYSLAYYANSIYNVDTPQGGTSDVRGMDVLEALYGSYTVFASEIKVTILRNSINQNFEVYLLPYSAVLNPATYGVTVIANMPNCKKRYIQVANTAKVSAFLNAKSTTANIVGVTKRAISDDNSQYQGLITTGGGGTVPTQQTYWNIMIYAADGAAFTAGDTFDVEIDIKYKCRFQVKNILDESG